MSIIDVKNKVVKMVFLVGILANTEIKRLKNKERLNCVDASILGYVLAKEMGYNVKFQETYSQKDNIWHVLLKVKGKELGIIGL